jgi:aminoglycoside phosphotransferase (APT) family kinase protein
VLRRREDADRLDEATRRAIGERVVDTLVEIHAVDPDAVGLGDLGKKADHSARTLHRWHGQWEKSKTRELPLVDEVHDRLAARIPEQGPATIVHGDYRLDNMILGPSGEVAAVVDWELCTLGDPLADVGLLMVYWGEPDDSDDRAALGRPTTVEGFPTRQDIIERYQVGSGRDLSHIDYYVAFGFWKLACIIEGVYARYVGGAMGERGEGFEAFAVQVERMAEAAREAAERLGSR